MKGHFKPGSVVQSFLDTDLYKYLMQQAIFEMHHSTEVCLTLYCFNKNNLGEHLHLIRDEIEKLGDLRFEESDIWFLSHIGQNDDNPYPLFKPHFLSFLRQFKLEPRQCSLHVDAKKQLKIDIKGAWVDVLHFQIFILTILHEIDHQIRYPQLGPDAAVQHLDAKLKKFFATATQKNIDLSDLRVCDFGTRNRFNYQTQWAVLDYLHHALPDPCFVGTSNVHIAKEMHLPCIGSQGVEWFMAHQQLSALHKFQSDALLNWVRVFVNHPGLALAGTTSLESFLHDFSSFHAKLYDGIRINSSDAASIIPAIIQHYQNFNISPHTKTLMLSDQLDFNEDMLTMYETYNQQIQLTFALRESLTCDFPKYKNLNIIMDLTECEGFPVARLNHKVSPKNPTHAAFISYLNLLFGS